MTPNAAISRSRPSAFSSPIAWRSLPSAAARSARSDFNVCSRAASSRASSSARRLTGPISSRSRRRRSSFSSISASSGSASPVLDLGQFRHRCPARSPACRGFRGRYRVSRRLAPSKRSSARCQFLARGRWRLPRPARASRSASASALFGALQNRSAHSCCAASRGLADLADHASAFLGENLRRVLQFGAVALGPLSRCADRSAGDLLAGAEVAAPDPAGPVGRERCQALVGELRLAHDCLLLGAHFGELSALAGDIVAHGGEFAFEFGGGRQSGQRAFGRILGGARLVAAGGEARVRLGQRREPRRLAVKVAFARARLGLGVARGIEGGLRRGQRTALAVDLGARRHQFAVDLGKPAALRQPAGGPGRRVRGGHEAVPAPEIAFARHQPLARLERQSELGAGLAPDQARSAPAAAPIAPAP